MADDGVAAKQCANPDCRIAETGKCVEGLETDKCPHFGHTPAEVGQDAADASDAESLELPGADTLDAEAAAEHLRAGDCRVVAIIGPSDSGKTSLIASLYDLFQGGAVAGVEFAGSDCLHGFEHACHDARAASRRNIPHINRTPRGEARYYQLDVGGGPAGMGLTLLLGDRAGEEYRSAADDTAIASSFVEVHRADTLAVLVDGERLLDTGARHNLRSEILMMLQALVDGAAVRRGQRLALVLTKIDLVRSSPFAERVNGDFTGLASRLRELFSDIFNAVELFEIAASPKTEAIARGTGVPELFLFWLGAASPLPTEVPPRPHVARLFARLAPRTEREARS